MFYRRTAPIRGFLVFRIFTKPTRGFRRLPVFTENPKPHSHSRTAVNKFSTGSRSTCRGANTYRWDGHTGAGGRFSDRLRKRCANRATWRLGRRPCIIDTPLDRGPRCGPAPGAADHPARGLLCTSARAVFSSLCNQPRVIDCERRGHTARAVHSRVTG